MDLGSFIIELLAQHQKVSVPGLGYFTLIRVNAYYNENERRFYPPASTIRFTAEENEEDDTFTQYIADKKNISLASSKYFTEKFTKSIKLQAATGEAAVANLGWFYTHESQLLLRLDDNLNTGTENFGLTPVPFVKLGQSPRAIADLYAVNAPEKPVTEQPLSQAAETQPGFKTSEEHEDYLIETTTKKKRWLTLTFIVLALLLVTVVVFVIHRYNPALLTLQQQPAPVTQPNKPTVITARVDTTSVKDSIDTVKKPVADTTALTKTVVNTDSLNKATTAIKDSVAGPRYEIMGGSFKDEKEANTAIKNYKKLNIAAHIVTDAPGRHVQVSIGTYQTREEAETVRKALIKTKKVGKDIYTLEIKPKL